MIRLGEAEPDTSPGNFKHLRGLGRTCFAQNWRGDWVQQVMHRISAPVGQDDDIQRARFVDRVLERLNAQKA